jgi:BirA family biotin operon repressor/biotin-[acetyl-CoA-carboxylase] ligase
LGIGLNVHTNFEGTPLDGRATSIRSETGAVIDRADLLARILTRIDHWATRLEEPLLLNAWRAWMATVGQRVTVRLMDDGQASQTTPQVLKGVALDVDDGGALVLRLDDDTTRHVVAGEVSVQDE